ncbi:hypothetical protein [Legionella fallonii]|uniref:Uncharacterized protein n=1 Tax=Legionella fallonii LLAP-10 TaxID=1212491 RepID=A0A098G3M9_9GAMM|nr:hypothetical protein [Legionella fallonii]CEG56090.1 protein of unknown function [Legionella fallonii LLAP-10]
MKPVKSNAPKNALKSVVDRRKKYANKLLTVLIGKYDSNGSYIRFNPENSEHAQFPKREITQGTFNRKRERALKKAANSK